MTRKEYNGWTNYETWNVNLWISNDQGLHEFCEEAARSAMENEDNDRHEAASSLATTIQELIEENNPISGDASVYSDLLNAALSEVNWYEIAEYYVNEVEVEEEEEA